MSRKKANPSQPPLVRGGADDYERLSAAQIAAARGHFFVKPAPPYPAPVKRPLRPLSQHEQARVVRNKDFVCTHMPELVPVIKELHEAGMIDGWRCVVEVALNPSTGTGRTV